MTCILLVEDDPEMRRLLTDFLQLEGFGVDDVADGSVALERVRQRGYECVLLDKDLASENGLDVLPHLRAMAPRTPVIFMTAFADLRTAQEAFARGAYAVLLKPFRLDHLLEVMVRACDFACGAAPAGGEPDAGRGGTGGAPPAGLQAKRKQT